MQNLRATPVAPNEASNRVYQSAKVRPCTETILVNDTHGTPLPNTETSWCSIRLEDYQGKLRLRTCLNVATNLMPRRLPGKATIGGYPGYKLLDPICRPWVCILYSTSFNLFNGREIAFTCKTLLKISSATGEAFPTLFPYTARPES